MNPLLQIKNNLTNEYVTIKVIQFGIDYNKVWGSSVKNMEGSTRATLIGVLPTIKAQTDYLPQDKVREFGALLNQPYMAVRFYDNLSGTTQTEPYTASDITVNMFRENGKQYEGLSFTLIPVDIQGVVS